MPDEDYSYVAGAAQLAIILDPGAPVPPSLAPQAIDNSYTRLPLGQCAKNVTLVDSAGEPVETATAAEIAGAIAEHLEDAPHLALGTTEGTAAEGTAPAAAVAAHNQAVTHLALGTTAGTAAEGTHAGDPAAHPGLFAAKLENKVADFTAVAFGRYQSAGTVIVTDPVSATLNDSYMVRVASGTATIGGVAYSPSRFDVIRHYNGSAWTTQTAVITGGLTVDGEAFAPVAGDVTLTDPLTALKLTVRGQMLIADSAWVFPTAAALTPTLTDNGNNTLAAYAGNPFIHLTVASSSTSNNTDCYLPATWPVGVPLVAYLNSTGATKGTIRIFGSSTETTILANSASTLTVAFYRTAAGWAVCSGIVRVVAGGLTGTITGGSSGTITGGNSGSITGGNSGSITGGNSGSITGAGSGTITGGNWCSIAGGNLCTITGGVTSTITGGNYGTARIDYEQCFGGGRFASGALNQERKWFFGVSTATTDPTDMLYFTIGTATAAVIPTETTLAIVVLVNARQDNGKSGMGRYLVQIERTINATRIVGSAVVMTAWQGDAELGTPTFAFTADDTNDCLKITITPANNTATRWGAKVIAHEVGF